MPVLSPGVLEDAGGAWWAVLCPSVGPGQLSLSPVQSSPGSLQAGREEAAEM